MNTFERQYNLARKMLADRFGPPGEGADFLPPGRRFKKNTAITAFAYALLRHFSNIKPFVLEGALRGRFNLREEWGGDPRTLFNDNRPGEVRARIVQVFGANAEDLDVDGGYLLALLQHLKNTNSLGRSTRAKMAYLKPVTGSALRNLSPSDLETHAPEVIQVTVELLERQKNRLRRQVKSADRIDALLGDLVLQYAVCRIRSLHGTYPLFSRQPDLFYDIYADELAQLMADHLERYSGSTEGVASGFKVITGRGIEVTYAKRNRDFPFLGDGYGDCTAWEVRSQVDPEVANIHWTVYAWLLDPFYRVLEVMVDGKPVLKGHIMPLRIHQRRVVMVDAIETIPSLRDTVRGRVNRNRSEKLYGMRLEILDAFFAHVLTLADRMGIRAIYVDKYSNTKWVRTEVDKLPSDSYHISEVVKPFGTAAITDVVRNVIGDTPADIREEIQAANVTLMDQYLQANHKEIGVLRGRREEYAIAIRGI